MKSAAIIRISTTSLVYYNQFSMMHPYKRCKQTVLDLMGGEAFICGPKDFLQTIQKQSYLAGCKTNNIFVDITK